MRSLVAVQMCFFVVAHASQVFLQVGSCEEHAGAEGASQKMLLVVVFSVLSQAFSSLLVDADEDWFPVKLSLMPVSIG